MLIAVPLVITMAVGLVLGLHLVSQGNASLKLSAQGTGAAATPSATGDGERHGQPGGHGQRDGERHGDSRPARPRLRPT